MTRESFEWNTIPVGAEEMAAKVTAVRRGVDVDELLISIDAGKPVLFDLGVAYDLYQTLLGPVESVIKDKRHLLVVPTGALTALPFHVLVTERPAVAAPRLEDMRTYRDAAWLIKRQAVSVLPSVASLEALRAFARTSSATRPMIGFGDPRVRPGEPEAGRASAGSGRGRRAPIPTIWRGAGVDRSHSPKPCRNCPTPPASSKPSRKARRPASDIHLGRDATETAVKARAAFRLPGRLFRHPWSGRRRRQGSGRAVARLVAAQAVDRDWMTAC